MKRLSLTFAALIGGLALTSSAFAQAKTAPKKDAKPAVASAPAPVSAELLKARMRPPVKGTASLEFISGPVKLVGSEVQSVIKVRNTDSAPIIGLKIDEYFYAGQKEISACTARVRNPIAAGEIVDVPISVSSTNNPLKSTLTSMERNVESMYCAPNIAATSEPTAIR